MALGRCGVCRACSIDASLLPGAGERERERHSLRDSTLAHSTQPGLGPWDNNHRARCARLHRWGTVYSVQYSHTQPADSMPRRWPYKGACSAVRCRRPAALCTDERATNTHTIGQGLLAVPQTDTHYYDYYYYSTALATLEYWKRGIAPGVFVRCVWRGPCVNGGGGCHSISVQAWRGAVSWLEHKDGWAERLLRDTTWGGGKGAAGRSPASRPIIRIAFPSILFIPEASGAGRLQDALITMATQPRVRIGWRQGAGSGVTRGEGRYIVGRSSVADETGNAPIQAWSLWIYDRHCCLIYHADWSEYHSRHIPRSQQAATSGGAAGSGGAAAAGSVGAPSSSSGGGGGGTSALPLAEQAKLVFGLVFSLRNMTRKLSPHTSQPIDASSSSTSSPAPTAGSSAMEEDTLHSFSTATYTLSHLQTPTKYTFVLLTDPVPPPTRRPPPPSSSSSSAQGTAATFSGGGGIPATGGMTTTGVLQQISRGPWVEFVARNAGCLSLERSYLSDDDDDEEEQDRDLMFGMGQTTATGLSDALAGVNLGAGASAGDDMDNLKSNERLVDAAALADRAKRREAKSKARREAHQHELHKRRLTGLGHSIDSEAFRASVERGESALCLLSPLRDAHILTQ